MYYLNIQIWSEKKCNRPHLASTLSERKITQNSLQFSAQSRRNLAFQCNGVQVKQMCQGTNEKAILKII